jgi:hypothetical protein
VLNGAMGGAIGAAALLLTILTNRPSVVLPWTLVVLGVLAVVPMLTVPTAFRLIVTGAITVGLIASGIVVFLNPHLLTRTQTRVKVQTKTVFRRPPLPATPAVTIDSPVAADQGNVPGCLNVKFRGTPPAGYGFAVAHHPANDVRTYFEGAVQQDPGSGEWSGTLVLGTTTSGMSSTYEISIVAIPLPSLQYLTQSRPEQDATWWSGTTNPPDSLPVSHFNVTRSTNPSVTC